MKGSDIEIGQRLRELRILTGMSIDGMALRMYTHRETVTRRESGQTKVTSANVRALLRIFPSLNLNWLFTGEGRTFAKH